MGKNRPTNEPQNSKSIFSFANPEVEKQGKKTRDKCYLNKSNLPQVFSAIPLLTFRFPWPKRFPIPFSPARNRCQPFQLRCCKLKHYSEKIIFPGGPEGPLCPQIRLRLRAQGYNLSEFAFSIPGPLCILSSGPWEVKWSEPFITSNPGIFFAVIDFDFCLRDAKRCAVTDQRGP